MSITTIILLILAFPFLLLGVISIWALMMWVIAMIGMGIQKVLEELRK
jgi:hypothetical protein